MFFAVAFVLLNKINLNAILALNVLTKINFYCKIVLIVTNNLPGVAPAA